jgi:mono/diheme cytochrome c family protein
LSNQGNTSDDKTKPRACAACCKASIFSSYCQVCHGENGDAGLSGAKNLITSTLTPTEKLDLIRLGKGNMPAFAASLPDDQILAIIDYTNTFKAK